MHAETQATLVPHTPADAIVTEVAVAELVTEAHEQQCDAQDASFNADTLLDCLLTLLNSQQCAPVMTGLLALLRHVHVLRDHSHDVCVAAADERARAEKQSILRKWSRILFKGSSC